MAGHEHDPANEVIHNSGKPFSYLEPQQLATPPATPKSVVARCGTIQTDEAALRVSQTPSWKASSSLRARRPPLARQRPSMVSYRRSVSGKSAHETMRNVPGVHEVLYSHSTLRRSLCKTRIGQVSDSQTGSKRNAKRMNIAIELLETERSYVDSLTSVQTSIIEPLVAALQLGAPILSSRKLSDIFSNFADVLYVSLALLSLLEARLEPVDTVLQETWSPEHDLLGDIFCQFGHYFKLYKTYCSNFTTAMKTLEMEVRNNKPFAAFLEHNDCIAALRRMSLHANLLGPVQRIPRYRLMLTALLACTPIRHPDYENLCTALNIVTASAASINEAIRQYESWTELSELQKVFLNLDEPLVACPNRRLLFQGPVIKICRKSHQHRMLFLFSDCLILARSVVCRTGLGEALSYHFFSCRIELASLLQAEIESSSRHSSRNDLFMWRIVSQQKSFLVYSSSSTTRARWLQAIRAAKTEQSAQTEFVPKPLSTTVRLTSSRPSPDRTLLTALKSTFWPAEDTQYPILRNLVAPIWVEDSATTVCQRCNAQFSFFRGRHHCRICGLVICKTCSKDRFMTSSKSSTHRACGACYTGILAARITDLIQRREVGAVPLDASGLGIPALHIGTYLNSIRRVCKARASQHDLQPACLLDRSLPSTTA